MKASGLPRNKSINNNVLIKLSFHFSAHSQNTACIIDINLFWMTNEKLLKIKVGLKLRFFCQKHFKGRVEQICWYRFISVVILFTYTLYHFCCFYLDHNER